MEAVRKLEGLSGELYPPRGSWAVGRHYLHPKGQCGAVCLVPQLLRLKRVPSTDPYAPGTKEYDGGPVLGPNVAHYTPRNKLRRAVTGDEMLAAEVYDVRRRAFDSYEASLSMGKLAWLIPWYGQVMHFRQWADEQRSLTPPGTVHPVLGQITGVPATQHDDGRSR